MTEDPKGTDLVLYEGPQPPTPSSRQKRQNVARNPGKPRVSPPNGEIQVNHCKNINCTNFGTEPSPTSTRGKASDGYRLDARNRGSGQRLQCTKCGQNTSLKSNAAIGEELKRISAYLRPVGASCPRPQCSNHGVLAAAGDGHYNAHGYTVAGTKRWRCKACGAVFSQRKARKQLMSHKNAGIFRHLVNKGGVKPMARVAGVSPRTVYLKLAFLQRQCLAYLADREQRIASLGLRRLYISVDRQDHIVNWTSRKDRKNVQLTAVASADNRSGYVFGMHTNFDPTTDREQMEAEAIVAGDFNIREPSARKFARFWTEPDYGKAQLGDPAHLPVERVCDTGDVWADVEAGYEEIEAIPDPEAKERTPKTTRLPSKGALIHYEYTVHAHFRLVRQLLGPVGKIRFFMDQDDTLRAACIATWRKEMSAGIADAFYVRIDKGRNVDQREELARKSRERFKAFKAAIGRPKMSDFRVRVMLLEESLQHSRQMSPRDAWVEFPESTMAEPKKAICWLTDRRGVAIPLRQLALVYARASMHTVDRYFMQIRRLLMAMERPISTPSNDGRVWRGYSPYDPARMQQVLDIYRCYYNFCKPGRDKRTPAMRLGLAKGPIRIEDILYFKPDGQSRRR